MTKIEKLLGVGVLIAIVIAVGAFLQKQDTKLGIASSPSDLSATNFTEVTAQQATFTAGTDALVLSTTNAATSSATIGCINMYATSTATGGKIRLSPTLTASGTRVVSWDFGTCP